MGRGGRVKQFGASDLVVRLMTQVASCRDLVSTGQLHLPRAAEGKAGISVRGHYQFTALCAPRCSQFLPWASPAQLFGFSWCQRPGAGRPPCTDDTHDMVWPPFWKTVTGLGMNSGSFSSESPIRLSIRRNALKFYQDFSRGKILPFSCL